MLKTKPLVVAIALAAVMHGAPAAAQLADPTKTRSTTQIVPPPPPPPVRQIDPVRPPAPTLPSKLGQREQSAPIQAPPPPGVPAPQTPAQRIGTAPAKVYDRNGRALNGMEQVGPNRVRDTRTGRYYNTVPAGDGQRVEP